VEAAATSDLELRSEKLEELGAILECGLAEPPGKSRHLVSAASLGTANDADILRYRMKV